MIGEASPTAVETTYFIIQGDEEPGYPNTASHKNCAAVTKSRKFHTARHKLGEEEEPSRERRFQLSVPVTVYYVHRREDMIREIPKGKRSGYSDVF